MALITSGTQTRVRWTWSGVAGAPYYSSLVLDQDSSDVVLEVSSIDTCLDDLDGYFVNDIGWSFDTSHEQFDIATGQVNGAASSNAASGAGTDPGNMLPRAAQIKLSFHTGEFLNGRELRGGMFLPAIQASVNSNGRVDEASALDIENRFDALFTEASELNHEAAIYSPTHRVSALISSVTVSREFAVLRSRRD